MVIFLQRKWTKWCLDRAILCSKRPYFRSKSNPTNLNKYLMEIYRHFSRIMWYSTYINQCYKMQLIYVVNLKLNRLFKIHYRFWSARTTRLKKLRPRSTRCSNSGTSCVICRIRFVAISLTNLVSKRHHKNSPTFIERQDSYFYCKQKWYHSGSD